MWLEVHAYPLGLRQGLLGDHCRGWLLLVRLLLRAQPVHQVHAPSADPNQPPRETVTQGHRLAVARHYRQHLGLGVAMMGPGGTRGLDAFCLVGGEEVTEVVGRRVREGPSLVGNGGGGGGSEPQTYDGGGRCRRGIVLEQGGHDSAELGGLFWWTEPGIYPGNEHIEKGVE